VNTVSSISPADRLAEYRRDFKIHGDVDVLSIGCELDVGSIGDLSWKIGYGELVPNDLRSASWIDSRNTVVAKTLFGDRASAVVGGL
jgi:hypothetical protein